MPDRGFEDKMTVLREIGLGEDSISQLTESMVSFRLKGGALLLEVKPGCHFVALKSDLFPLHQTNCPTETAHCDAWLAAKDLGLKLAPQDHNNAGVSCAWNGADNWREDAKARLQAAADHEDFGTLSEDEQATIKSNLELAKSDTPPTWLRMLSAETYGKLAADLKDDLEAGNIPGLRFEA